MLHTADWHLGKTLGDLSREEEHVRFLTWLAGAIEEHGIDVLLVAGDVFDSAHPAQSAVSLYYNFISEIHRRSNCEIVITAGNHDSPAHLEAPRHVLAALRTRVVGHLPQAMEDALVVLPNRDAPRLLVAAIPFLRDRDLRRGEFGQSAESIREQLVQGMERCYAEAARGLGKLGLKEVPAVAMGHLTVSGGETCPESEREIHVGGLGTVTAAIFPRELSYVALGHLHRPQEISERIRYSGSPLPLSFAESDDEKEVRIVDFEGSRVIGNYALKVPLARRLIRWRLRRAELDHYMRVKAPPKSALTPWVEVEVEDPHPGENIFETVQELSRDRPFEAVRVGSPRREPSRGFNLDPNNSVDQAEDLLANPLRVFGQRLDEMEELNEAERERLEGAFRELLNLREERAREEPETVSS